MYFRKDFAHLYPELENTPSTAAPTPQQAALAIDSTSSSSHASESVSPIASPDCSDDEDDDSQPPFLDDKV